MDGVLVLSVVALWVIVVLMAVVLLALARQVGLINRRLPPPGVSLESLGPEVGDPFRVVTATTIDGRTTSIGGAQPSRTLYAFVGPGCPACEELAPALRSLAHSESDLAVQVVSTSTDDEQNRAFARRHHLDSDRFVASASSMSRYGIPSTPYVVVVSAEGNVLMKGVANHMDHLDSLLTHLGNGGTQPVTSTAGS